MPPSWLFALAHYDQDALKTADVSRLPIVVCAVLIRLLPATDSFAGMRTDLARWLLQRMRQPGWIGGTGLAEVCGVLDGVHAFDEDAVGGAELAGLARRLLDLEVAVGGPYRHEPGGRVELLDNAMVAQCMEWMAAPLPNVMAYLHELLPESKHVESSSYGLMAAIGSLEISLATTEVLQLQEHADLIKAALCAAIVHSSELHLGLDEHDDTHVAEAGHRLASSIHESARHLLTPLPEPLNSRTRIMLEDVMRVDTLHEISLLAWMYGRALAEPAAIDSQMYRQLGLANLFAWAAYTIYDDFLDNEGDPQMLGTANYCLRTMLQQYHTVLPADNSFHMYVRQCLTAVDRACVYETTSFRFEVSTTAITVGPLPDYGDRSLLADRAMFHVFGPMGVLAASGVGVGSDAWRHAEAAWRHYLIARQLNDDVHDWVADLHSGQATYVVTELLRYLNVGTGRLPLDQLMPIARQQFWQSVLPDICDTALEHMRAARRELELGPDMHLDDRLSMLFDRVSDSMIAAKAKRHYSQELLKSFTES